MKKLLTSAVLSIAIAGICANQALGKQGKSLVTTTSEEGHTSHKINPGTSLGLSTPVIPPPCIGPACAGSA